MKAFPFPLNSRYGLLHAKMEIPREIQVPVALIFHELMNRMIFEHLRKIGMYCDLEHFQDSLILASLNMHDGTDETLKVYIDLMDHWSKNVNTDRDVIVRRALKIYQELIKARGRRKNAKTTRHNRGTSRSPTVNR
jgi:hypothetical protein